MSTGRFAAPGKTRSCPHCRATILDSATVCPGCHHHLRFGSAGQRPQEVVTPLRVEGTFRHPPDGATWEYSVVLCIRNDRGEEIARQVVGVGALHPSEARTFALAVEVFKPAEVREPKPEASVSRATAAPGMPARPGAPAGAGIPGGPRPPSGPGLPGGPGLRSAPGPGGSSLPGAAGPGSRQEPARSPPAAGQPPAAPGAGPGRPGSPAVRPTVAPPQQDGSALRPRSGSVFKDPRVPGGSPGLQPKRR